MDSKTIELETERIMGSIGDELVKQAMTELLFSGIKIRYVKVKAMGSKTIHSIITPEELSRKFSIGIDKAKDTLRVTT